MPDWLAIVKGYVDDLETRLTAARAGYLDNLSAGPVALAASWTAALATALGNYTAARAAYLDNINQAGLLQVTAARAALLDQITALRLAELDAANLPTDVNTIQTQTDKLAGAAPVVGSVNANWNTAAGTSGEIGEDLVTIGANGVRNKVLSLVLNVSALTAGSTVTVKMFMEVNGVERKIYSESFLKEAQANGSEPDGLWIISGVLGIHEALRVEVYSTTNESVAIAYDYMLEVM